MIRPVIPQTGEGVTVFAKTIAPGPHFIIKGGRASSVG
jgi:hypothetical protein